MISVYGKCVELSCVIFRASQKTPISTQDSRELNLDISILKFKLIAIFSVANEVYNFGTTDAYSRNMLRISSKRLLRLTNGVFFETVVLVLIGV